MTAHAQDRAYVGGALGVAVDPQSRTPSQAGGTTWTGSIVVGTPISQRLSLEVEPSFSGEVDAAPYTYQPGLDRVVNVVAHVQRTYLAVLLRARASVAEPVVGLSLVRYSARRHATLADSGKTYFDDERLSNGLALAGGLDLAIPASRRVALVPSFRMFFINRGRVPGSANNVRPGPVVFRAGVGLRVRLGGG